MLNVKLEAVAVLDDRLSRRLASSLQQAVAEGRAEPAEGVLHDVSSTTFLIETSAALEKGAMISLSLPGIGACAGEIAWASERFSGGCFHAPPDHPRLFADPAVCRDLCDRYIPVVRTA